MTGETWTDTARTIRAAGAREAAATIRAALADPHGRAAVLAAIFTDRGLRDAALAITAKDGDWPRLAAAAEAAGRWALAGARPGANGALTVLAVTAWVGGRHGEALQMCEAVDGRDSAARMAVLVAGHAAAGIPAEAWIARTARVPLSQCIAFDVPPATAPATARAAAWFAAGPAEQRGDGPAAGWSLAPLHTHPAGAAGRLALLERDGDPVALVSVEPGGEVLTHFPDRADEQAWRRHVSATAAGDDAAAVRAMAHPGTYAAAAAAAAVPAAAAVTNRNRGAAR